MKSDSVEMCMLFDFYAEMLTEKQREAFDFYYNDDLSLAEISEQLGITRQGVRDAIVRSETVLRETEQRLHLVERFSKVREKSRMINELTDSIRRSVDYRRLSSETIDRIDKINRLASEMVE